MDIAEQFQVMSLTIKFYFTRIFWSTLKKTQRFFRCTVFTQPSSIFWMLQGISSIKNRLQKLARASKETWKMSWTEYSDANNVLWLKWVTSAFSPVRTQLATVKLGFDQIRTMTSVSSGFRCSLLFLLLFVASQSLAKPGNNANSTPVSSAATKHCNNVYNSFYAGPNKKIETILQEIKKQLTQLQDDIDILKGNKTTVKGKICFFA